MLEALPKASPAALSTEPLLEQVWDENLDPSIDTVKVTISRLGRKLGAPDAIHATREPATRSPMRPDTDTDCSGAARLAWRRDGWRGLAGEGRPGPVSLARDLDAGRGRPWPRRGRPRAPGTPARSPPCKPGLTPAGSVGYEPSFVDEPDRALSSPVRGRARQSIHWPSCPPVHDRYHPQPGSPVSLRVAGMRLDGIHHITCITADARGNVDFYARVLGMRLVKKTVNFDAPDVYHLYYGDERGAPGSILTFFEFPDAAPGRAGAGMIHRLRWRLGSDDAVEFWAERLAREGVEFDLDVGDRRSLAFRDPEGLGLELAVVHCHDEPLVAAADGIAPEHALRGFDGVRAFAHPADRPDRLLTETMGFEMPAPDTYVLAGGHRGASYAHDRPPTAVGVQGAGTVHHIAWCDRDQEHAAWREQLARVGAHPTPIVDRQYFQSIYFRELGGVLFEIATPSPGFAIDEDPDHLGEELRLPPQHEHLRDRLTQTLRPLANPRAKAVRP